MSWATESRHSYRQKQQLFTIHQLFMEHHHLKLRGRMSGSDVREREKKKKNPWKFYLKPEFQRKRVFGAYEED